MIEYSCTSDTGGYWLWYYRVNFDTTNLLANERAYYKVLVNYTGVSPNWYWYVFAFDGDKRSLGDSGRIPATQTRSSDGAIQTIDSPVLYSYYDSTNDVTFYSCPIVNASIQYGPNPNIEYTASSSDYYNLPYSTWAPLARAYFDNFVPGQGVGEVTLQTDPPSQLLTFTSQKLGQSFKYWIRGNQTIELYTPEEHEDEVLWIFKDGQFTNAVKDDFDISQFRSSLARPEGDINALSEWFLTAYALLQGALYGEPFYIENGYLRKSGNIGSSTSSTGRPVGETNTNFYIPIKRVTGFTKIVYEGITIQNNGTSGGEDYNIISVKAAMINGSNAFVKSQASGGGVSQDNWATYEYSIADLDHVDYINLFGCDGSPAYRNIRLVKPGS